MIQIFSNILENVTRYHSAETSLNMNENPQVLSTEKGECEGFTFSGRGRSGISSDCNTPFSNFFPCGRNSFAQDTSGNCDFQSSYFYENFKALWVWYGSIIKNWLLKYLRQSVSSTNSTSEDKIAQFSYSTQKYTKKAWISRRVMIICIGTIEQSLRWVDTKVGVCVEARNPILSLMLRIREWCNWPKSTQVAS